MNFERGLRIYFCWSLDSLLLSRFFFCAVSFWHEEISESPPSCSSVWQLLWHGVLNDVRSCWVTSWKSSELSGNGRDCESFSSSISVLGSACSNYYELSLNKVLFLTFLYSYIGNSCWSYKILAELNSLKFFIRSFKSTSHWLSMSSV